MMSLVVQWPTALRVFQGLVVADMVVLAGTDRCMFRGGSSRRGDGVVQRVLRRIAMNRAILALLGTALWSVLLRAEIVVRHENLTDWGDIACQLCDIQSGLLLLIRLLLLVCFLVGICCNSRCILLRCGVWRIITMLLLLLCGLARLLIFLLAWVSHRITAGFPRCVDIAEVRGLGGFKLQIDWKCARKIRLMPDSACGFRIIISWINRVGIRKWWLKRGREFLTVVLNDSSLICNRFWDDLGDTFLSWMLGYELGLLRCLVWPSDRSLVEVVANTLTTMMLLKLMVWCFCNVSSTLVWLPRGVWPSCHGSVRECRIWLWSSLSIHRLPRWVEGLLHLLWWLRHLLGSLCWVCGGDRITIYHVWFGYLLLSCCWVCNLLLWKIDQECIEFLFDHVRLLFDLFLRLLNQLYRVTSLLCSKLLNHDSSFLGRWHLLDLTVAIVAISTLTLNWPVRKASRRCLLWLLFLAWIVYLKWLAFWMLGSFGSRFL